jgi:hypothetical protein
LLWQKEIYIPGMPDTGLFYDHLCELPEQDETSGKHLLYNILQTTAKIMINIFNITQLVFII